MTRNGIGTAAIALLATTATSVKGVVADGTPYAKEVTGVFELRPCGEETASHYVSIIAEQGVYEAFVTTNSSANHDDLRFHGSGFPTGNGVVIPLLVEGKPYDPAEPPHYYLYFHIRLAFAEFGSIVHELKPVALRRLDNKHSHVTAIRIGEGWDIDKSGPLVAECES